MTGADFIVLPVLLAALIVASVFALLVAIDLIETAG